MTRLRHFLLVLALVFGQLAAAMHAVEHAAGKDGALTTHACQFCLAAHDLGAALPGLAALPPVLPPAIVPATVFLSGRAQLPPPRASQRAPPFA